MKSATKLHDEHMHLRPHGVRPLPEYKLAPLLAACAARDLVPGIREHAPLPERYRLGPDGDYLFCMRASEVDAFLGELEGQGVPVGFEVDHIDGLEDETRAIVADLLDRARARGIPIGGLTGSVHFILGRVPDLEAPVPGAPEDQPSAPVKVGVPHILCDYLESVMQAHLADHGAEATVREYFASVRRLVHTGLFDVVGHIELIRKWDRRDPTGRSTLFGDVEDTYAAELDQTLRLAAEADIIVEYNTSGRDIVIGRPYLSDDAVRACVRYGTPIALSSDTHLPKHAGRYFDEAVQRLRSLGVRQIHAVRDRQRIAIPL
jgi:HisJ family histidinol phosphate phosphatase